MYITSSGKIRKTNPAAPKQQSARIFNTPNYGPNKGTPKGNHCARIKLPHVLLYGSSTPKLQGTEKAHKYFQRKLCQQWPHLIIPKKGSIRIPPANQFMNPMWAPDLVWICLFSHRKSWICLFSHRKEPNPQTKRGSS